MLNTYSSIPFWSEFVFFYVFRSITATYFVYRRVVKTINGFIYKTNKLRSKNWKFLFKPYDWELKGFMLIMCSLNAYNISITSITHCVIFTLERLHQDKLRCFLVNYLVIVSSIIRFAGQDLQLVTHQAPSVNW